MTVVALQENDATSMAKAAPVTRGVGDSSNSGGGKSSGMMMTVTTGNKDYKAGRILHFCQGQLLVQRRQ
jgi:hypothetical protein